MKIILSLAALAATLSAQPAFAQPPAAGRTIAVHHADLDLGSPAGVSALDRRLRSAVRIACEASDSDLQGRNAERRCRADTLESVQAQRETLIALARRSTTILASQ